MPDDLRALSSGTADIMRHCNDAFLRHDPEALPPLVAADCVIANTQPAPDGSRHVGRDACLAVWQGIAGNRAAHFELEDVEAHGERAIIRP